MVWYSVVWYGMLWYIMVGNRFIFTVKPVLQKKNQSVNLTQKYGFESQTLQKFPLLHTKLQLGIKYKPKNTQ